MKKCELKKVVAILLMFVFCFSILTACGSSNGDDVMGKEQQTNENNGDIPDEFFDAPKTLIVNTQSKATIITASADGVFYHTDDGVFVASKDGKVTCLTTDLYDESKYVVSRQGIYYVKPDTHEDGKNEIGGFAFMNFSGQEEMIIKQSDFSFMGVVGNYIKYQEFDDGFETKYFSITDKKVLDKKQTISIDEISIQNFVFDGDIYYIENGESNDDPRFLMKYDSETDSKECLLTLTCEQSDSGAGEFKIKNVTEKYIILEYITDSSDFCVFNRETGEMNQLYKCKESDDSEKYCGMTGNYIFIQDDDLVLRIDVTTGAADKVAFSLKYLGTETYESFIAEANPNDLDNPILKPVTLTAIVGEFFSGVCVGEGYAYYSTTDNFNAAITPAPEANNIYLFDVKDARYSEYSSAGFGEISFGATAGGRVESLSPLDKSALLGKIEKLYDSLGISETYNETYYADHIVMQENGYRIAFSSSNMTDTTELSETLEHMYYCFKASCGNTTDTRAEIFNVDNYNLNTFAAAATVAEENGVVATITVSEDTLSSSDNDFYVYCVIDLPSET